MDTRWSTMDVETVKLERNICGFLRMNEVNNIIYCCSECDCEFVNGSEIEKHICNDHIKSYEIDDYNLSCIQILFEMNSIEKSLIDLDILCLDNIFQHLDPNDLAAMSETCARFKHLAEAHFVKRKLYHEMVQIDANGFNFDGVENYVRCFPSFIRCACVDIKHPYEFTQLCQFIQENCNMELDSLVLAYDYQYNKSSLQIRPNDFGIISKQLKHLKVLALDEMPDKEIEILKLCENLETLIVSIHVPAERYSYKGITLLPELSPKLDTLILSISRYGDVRIPKEFLQTQTALNAIFSENCWIINDLLLNETKLTYFGLSFDYNHDFDLWTREIRMLCERNIKTLDLVFNHILSDRDFDGIDDMSCLTGLHCPLDRPRAFFYYEYMRHATTRIKRLCLKISCQSKKLGHRIVKCFPNLQELRLDSENGLISKKIINRCIRHLKHLKHIYVTSSEMSYTEPNLIGLNTARWKLEMAENVILHLDETNRKYITTIAPDHQNIVAIAFEKNVICPFCNREPGRLIQLAHSIKEIRDSALK